MDFLFDIGNVLLTVDFDKSLLPLLPPDTCAADVMRLLLERKDDLESGRIDNDSFLDWAIAATGTRASRDEFTAAWLDVFHPIEPMWATVEELAAAGHRLILFSNTNDLHASHAFEHYPVFQHFHGAVYSHLVGSMKPRETIYQHAVRRFGLTPADTLYIDDLPENIATGQRLGFRCWQYLAGEHPAFTAWLGTQLAKR